MDKSTVTESDLLAYADNRLSDARRREVERYLAGHPHDAQRIERDARIKDDLHALFDPVLHEAIPERLLQTLNTPAASQAAPAGKWTRLRRLFERVSGLGRAGGLLVPASPLGSWNPASYALTLGWLALGVLLGWQMQLAQPHRDMPPMVRHAAVAYTTYASEVAHPVEIQASHEDHLEAWLTRRLGVDVRAPELHTVGLTLMGGRLLAGTQGPAAQFMYEDKIGRRLTLYIKTQEMRYDESMAFRFAQEREVNAFYWIDNGTGFVLSGNLDRADLLKVAESAYQQLKAPPDRMRDTKKSAALSPRLLL